MAASSTEKPVTEKPLFNLDGAPLVAARDAARYFGVEQQVLTGLLYRGGDAQRYRAFEIPKRSGGVRQIHAPTDQLRTLQDRIAGVLQDALDAHPQAHGFIRGRSIVSNAKAHVNQRLVLNVDLADFFPSINFGRIRGLFMAPPFALGPAAATIFAQICTFKNGLPQGAPTSPVLSNYIAASLDRRLMRIAKENNLRYSRYADDITFSTNQNAFPVPVAEFTQGESTLKVRVGEAVERAINASGFSVNHGKVRLQTRHQRQSVTGLNVNAAANVERVRVRRLRALFHAWEKFGLEAAAREHFVTHRRMKKPPANMERAFRNRVYGELSFLKMVRGAEDEIFLRFCAKLIALDPNPSRFVRAMVFGADDFDVFISHASEDKEAVARPIFEACRALGVKAFLDEAHIGWGQGFTTKINSALGAARTVVAIITPTSVNKDWPVAEINAALGMEVTGQKKVVPVIVGKPDLSRLPLIAAKDAVVWNGDAEAVAKRVQAAIKGDAPRRPEAPRREKRRSPPSAPASALNKGPWGTRAPVQPRSSAHPARPRKKGNFFTWLFGSRPPKRK